MNLLKKLDLSKITFPKILAVLFFGTVIWSMFALADYPPVAERVTNVYGRTDLALPDGLHAERLYPTRGGIFVSASDEDDGSRERLLRLDTDGFVELTLALAENERLVDLDADSSGTPILLTFTRDIDSGEEVYILSRIENGSRRILCDDLLRMLESSGYPTESALDLHGNVYLSLKNTVFVFDASLNFQFDCKLPSSVESLDTDSSGRVFATYLGAGYRMSASVIDFAAGTLGESIAIPDLKRFSNAEVRFASAENSDSSTFEHYLDAATGLYGVCSDGTTELLCDWVNSDVIRGSIGELAVLDSNRMLCRAVDGLYLLERIPDEEVPKKFLIKVAVRYANSSIVSRLIGFNRQSDEYRAVLVEYGGDNTSTEQGVAELRINADLHSKNAPDVICVTDFMLADEWLKSYAFLELTQALFDGEWLSDGDFVKGILDVFSYNGKLYELPERFTLTTLLGKRANLPSESWNIVDFVEFARTLPHGAVLCESGIGIDELLPLSLGRYANLYSGTADFNRPGFGELLELLTQTSLGKRYEDTITGDALADYRMGGQSRVLAEDRVMLSRLEFTSLAQYISGGVRFGGEETVSIGYPTDRGNGTLVRAQSSWAITTKSRVQDGALELIAYLIENSTGFGFSALEEIFADEIAEECARGYFFGFGGGITGYDKNDEPRSFGKNGVVRDITEEDVSALRELIRGASRTSVYDREIMAIVNEELEAYFADAKSLESTIAVINNRVGIYVRENQLYSK